MLLELPSTFRRPDQVDAGEEIELACDWIEASILFSGETIASPVVTNVLAETRWFHDRKEARDFVDLVWNRLRVRRLEVGGCGPFDFDYQTIQLTISSWEKSPAYVFCLLLSYARHHLKWSRSKKLKWDYNKQGEIFESLCCGALEQLLPCWTIYRTGWSSKETAQLATVVKEIAKHLCGEVGNIKRWNKKQAEEQGLDILCYRRFHDGNGNFPAFLVQCASGRQFEDKLHDPDLEVWNDLVALVPRSLPRKAFTTPFTFPKRHFERHAIKSKGLLLDRNRLLSAAAHKQDWLDSKVGTQIQKWAKPFIQKLPWIK